MFYFSVFCRSALSLYVVLQISACGSLSIQCIMDSSGTSLSASTWDLAEKREDWLSHRRERESLSCFRDHACCLFFAPFPNSFLLLPPPMPLPSAHPLQQLNCSNHLLQSLLLYHSSTLTINHYLHPILLYPRTLSSLAHQHDFTNPALYVPKCLFCLMKFFDKLMFSLP